MERGPPPDAPPTTLHTVVQWLIPSPLVQDPNPEPALLAAEAAYADLRARFCIALGVLEFEALWMRALHLTVRQAHPADAAHATRALADGLPGLRPLVAMVAPATVHALLRTVLTRFFAVVVPFIGAPLTVRILRQIWPTLPAEARTPA